MPFTYARKIRFQDTDAAGVVYFANVLAMCHEAYEESLATSGINLKSFFSNSTSAIPIVHADVDFFRPLFCGEQISVHLKTKYLDDRFEVIYEVVALETNKLVAKATTTHVCIDPTSRKRKDLPDEMTLWLQQTNAIVSSTLQC